MTEYISKQVHVTKPDFLIYQALSDFNNFTPILKDKVENWSVEGDVCSFKAKGFTLKLQMVEKEPNKTIKIGGVDVPFEFNFWIQIKGLENGESRMRMVVRAKLNAMMKMMVGKKLQKGLDEIADQIATAFNSI